MHGHMCVHAFKYKVHCFIYFFNFVAVVESLLGSVNRPTDSVNVNRVSTIYSELVEDLQDIDFVNLDFIRTVGICI